MKTLADFKRALTIGSKWDTFYRNQHLGVGEVVTRKSDGVCFERYVNGEKKHSWFYYPKVEFLKIQNDTVFRYSEATG